MQENQQHCDQNFLTKHPITGQWPHVFVLWRRSWKRADFSNYSIVWAGQEGADWIAGGGQRPVFTDDGRLPSEWWSPGLYLHLHQQEDPCLCCSGRQERERERQETGGETMSCFLSSCDITMFVVLWLCHNKPCRFLYIAFPKYKVTDFKMWMVLPGWQIKNLLETNNICGSWYTCTTQLSSHRRAAVENYFFSILVFNFLLISAISVFYT